MTSQQSNTPWIKEIKGALSAQLFRPVEAPKLPSFPWEDLEKAILAAFNLASCQLTLQHVSSAEEQNLPELNEGAHLFLHLNLNPIQEKLILVFSLKDLSNVTKLLTGSNEELSFADTELGEAFNYFFFANIVHCIEQSNYLSSINYSFSLSKDLPELSPDSLCLTIEAKLNELSLHTYLITKPQIKQELKSFLVNQSVNTVSDNIAENTSVDIKVEVGKVELDQQSIKSLRQGDFVILDSCSYQMNKGKSRATLTINGKPIFRVLFAKDHVKLLEYPIFQEVNNSMSNDKETENDDFNLEDQEIPSLDEDELSLEAELGDTAEISEEELGASLNDSPPSEELASEAPTEATNDSADNSELAAAAAPPPEDKTQETLAPAQAINPHAPLVSPEDIPVNLQVEVSTLRMTLKDLMQLEPGQTLELDALPEQGVSLVNNGKAVARGQLIQVGDLLGVKILELKN